MSLFATNDELFAKLRAGNPGFDVIVPSNEFVTRLRLAGLLTPLDLAKIPNRVNLLPAFQNPPFDPGRRLVDALHLADARSSAIASRRPTAFPTAGSG